MNIDYIKKMFVGEILIVDDEVNEEYTDAWEIAEYLREQNFSVITKDTFPNNNELAGHNLMMQKSQAGQWLAIQIQIL